MKYLVNIATGKFDTQDKKENGIYPFFVRSPQIEKIDKYSHTGEAVMTAGDGVGVGKVFHYYNGKFAAHQRLYVFNDFKKDVFGKYIYYSVMSNLKFEVLQGNAKSTVDSLRYSMLAHFPILLPNYDIQIKVVNFLDQKTTEIDDLIADKEKLIELLEEKRQAIITEAVTKGLDPNVKMKDSGVEWIGEIPEHWKVKRLKYLFQIKKRIEGLKNPNILSVTQKGIKVKDITTNEGQLAANYDKYQTVNVGDYVMNHMDLLTGFIDVSKYKGVTSPDYRVFAIKDEKFDRQYFLYYFQMSYYRKIFYKFGQGVSSFGRWRLPADEFYNFCVPVPTIEEQKEVVKYISSHVEDSENVIEQTKCIIKKLKEYRQSLIYEAVTGKIDVQEIVNETEPEGG
ncbi:type I restriction-modification system [Gracilibacillus boraciitolerans JCM 21714]|uniref:Type I restriction-modification system n=1 Tax=Gracilibacillus boraciitolerans JCM 21714 TaxID=1298598 RepID=W4VD31_9BACI|nr:type I restriction-modification system [Gracilibacillus boraciitolerans JCM 21714]